MTLNQDTKITIGTAIAVVTISISATWWFAVKLNEFEVKISNLSDRVASSEAKESGVYTLAAASEQALRMAIENPGMRVPDPRDPQRIIEVKRKQPE